MEIKVKTTQNLWKEYARTYWLHEKTKNENHGNWRRRGASKRSLKYIQQNNNKISQI
jgi:hypothetical protein